MEHCQLVFLDLLAREQTSGISKGDEVNRNVGVDPWQARGFLLACITLAWGGVLFGSFQYDDFPNILTDPATAGGTALMERLTTGIRPLTRLSYALDHALWGRWAGGWLLTNFLLHLATAYGVWRLVLARGASVVIALTAGALFALQPASGMTVAYVSGRSTGLMTALLVGALVAFEIHVRTQNKAYLVSSLLLSLLACTAKEVALVFPALLLLWTFTRLKEGDAMRPAATSIAPFVLVAVTGVAVALSSPRYRGLLTYSMDLRTPLESLVANASALPATLSLLVRPWSLAVEHAAPSGFVATTIGAIVLLAWFAIALSAWRKHPWLTFGMLWPVFALLPTHSVIAKVDAVSETSLYLAWAGPSIALAVGCREWFASGRRRVAVGLVTIVLSLTCAWRTVVWGDPVRLWREAVATAPMSARTWNNLGQAYMAKAHPKEAKRAFQMALKLEPGNVRALRNLDLLEVLD